MITPAWVQIPLPVHYLIETVNILQHEVEEFINGYVRESFVALLTVSFKKLKQLMKSITGILNHD